MSVVRGLDKSKGLDLFLHTPGGDVGATESLIDYLFDSFGEILERLFLRLQCLVEL